MFNKNQLKVICKYYSINIDHIFLKHVHFETNSSRFINGERWRCKKDWDEFHSDKKRKRKTNLKPRSLEDWYDLLIANSRYIALACIIDIISDYKNLKCIKDKRYVLEQTYEKIIGVDNSTYQLLNKVRVVIVNNCIITAYPF
jgi:hypothetical protein